MATENVAILFTDVVGSTALSSRLHPEDADQLRRTHFAILRRSLAKTGGTELKALGDGIMAVFVSASAALRCAVLMQQGIDNDNRQHDHRIGLRIGLSGGEVTREEDDCFGDPVVQASRLCSTAEAGQIIAARVIELMAGRRNPHTCRALGTVPLKGLPEPIEAVEVVWEPAARDPGSGIPLPRRLTTRPAVGVLGRDTEVALIADALTRVDETEKCEVLLVSGEAGLGKTTVVAEAARAAFDSGASVLVGHCEEGLAPPYQLFAESLGHYVAHVDKELLVAHVDTHGSELSRLVPNLAVRLPNLPPSTATDADTERFLLFAAVAGLLSAASAKGPVVLLLDDLQWADEASLLLLRHVAAAEQPMRLLILGIYRDTELAQSDPLQDALGVLRRHTEVSRIELDGLDDRGVVAFMEAAAGHELDEAGMGLAHAVFLETDGNPFFVGEVLRHLSEVGAIRQGPDGRWTATAPLDAMTLPDSIREVVGGRVARIGTEARRVLSVASVIGRDFDLEALARASESREDALVELLDAAGGASLVREDADAPGHYSFVHALIQHTMYEDLGPTRRSRLHRRVAEALEDVLGDNPGVRVGELARHWMSTAQSTDIPKAVRYCRQAGEAALKALAPADALNYFAQALSLLERSDDVDPVLALDLAIGMGTSQRQTGDPMFRDTLLETAHRAADIGDADRLVAAALANDRGFYSAVGHTDVEKVDVLEQAVKSPALADQSRALVVATLCSELAHGSPLERRRELADEAVTLAKTLGDDATIVRVLNHVYLPLQVPHFLDLALERTAEALMRAQRLGDPALLYWASMWRAETAARACDIDEMDACIDIHGAMAQRLDEPLFHWGHAFGLGLRAIIAGDVDDAERCATNALHLGTECGQPDSTTIFGAQLMNVCGQRGTMSGLIPMIEQMASETPDISPLLFGSLLAKAHAEAGRTDEASAFLARFAAANFDLPLDQVWLTGMVDYADAAIECGDRRYAEPLFDLLAPWADQLPATGASALAPVAHYLGGLATVLGRYDAADAYFSRSAELSSRAGATFFAARTHLYWAKMLVERGGPEDAERARTLLASASGDAVAHGYGAIERSASELAAALPR